MQGGMRDSKEEPVHMADVEKTLIMQLALAGLAASAAFAAAVLLRLLPPCRFSRLSAFLFLAAAATPCACRNRHCDSIFPKPESVRGVSSSPPPP